MPVVYLDPVPESSAEHEPYTLRMDASSPVRIGLVANSFPGSARFLDAIAAALGPRLPATFVAYAKDEIGLNASMTIHGDQIEGMRPDVDAIVTAYGH